MVERAQEAALKARKQYLSNCKERNEMLKKTLADLNEERECFATSVREKVTISMAMLEIVKYLNGDV